VRLQSSSTDGGRTWSAAVKKKQLPEPIEGCEGALIRHPNGKHYFR